MNAITEAKRIDGKPAHRLEGSPAGAWVVEDTEIDAILNRVRKELGVTRTAIYNATGLHAESVSRCRKGQYRIVEEWILRLSDYSGIPVSELRQVACIEPRIHPHAKARSAA